MASSEEIKWVVTADDKDIIAAFKRMQKELESTKQKMREQANESTKASKAQKAGLDDTVTGLGRMAMGWLSVQTAIQLATAEYQNYIDKQNESKQEVLKTADAQMAFFRNLGNVSSEYAKRIQATIKQIAAANNVPESSVYQVASIARSSQGSLTDAQMFANVGMATRLAPESLSEQTALAGALNAATRLTGSTDPRTNAGLMLGIGEQTRIDNMAQISKVLIPAASGIKATLGGTSTEEAMALLTTLTTVSEDESGATSRTAGLRLAAQLRKYRKATDLGDEISKIQSSPQEFASFMKKASFEIEQQPFIEKLLTGGTPAAELYKQNLAKVPTGARAQSVTDQFFKNVGAAEYQQVAQQQRAFAATKSGLELDDLMGAQTSVNREWLQKVLVASNAGRFEQFGQSVNFGVQTMMGVRPEVAARDVLEERISSIRGFDGDAPRARAEDPAQERVAQKLEAMIAELRGLRMDNKNAPKKKNIDRNAEQ